MYIMCYLHVQTDSLSSSRIKDEDFLVYAFENDANKFTDTTVTSSHQDISSSERKHNHTVAVAHGIITLYTISVCNVTAVFGLFFFYK